MKRYDIVSILWAVALLTTLLGLSACVRKTLPPEPNIADGGLLTPEGFGRAHFWLLQWSEGLSITIVDDIEGEHQSSSSGSTQDPVSRVRGSARGHEGQHITWRVETTDGKGALFFLNEQLYDLSQGTLFLIKTSGGSVQVRQEQRGHNRPCSDFESCEQLLWQDPAIMQFVHETMQSR
jgi:hypothetical protein